MKVSGGCKVAALVITGSEICAYIVIPTKSGPFVTMVIGHPTIEHPYNSAKINKLIGFWELLY